MKIPVAGLPEGVHEFAFVSSASALDLVDGFQEIRVSVSIAKSDREMHLHGNIETAFQCTCDRCLKEFVSPLSPSFILHYVFTEADAGKFDPAETQTLAPGTTTIDIGDDVRQVIQVAVPLKLLCAETCKGLCPQCGRNLNDGPCDCRPEPLDPRWDALRDLRTNE